MESLEGRTLLSAGDPDLTFGGSGGVLLPQPSSGLECRVRATAAQSDGKVLVAGSIGTLANGGQGEFFLERLNQNGSVDTTFGIGGFVQTAIGSNSFATSILLQPDGKIIVGGATDDAASAPTNASFALARYNPDGSLDTTFGAGGIVVTDFAGNEEVDSLAFSPGGGIVAAGSYSLSSQVGFDIARYVVDGMPDPKFNQTGQLQYDLGQSASGSLPTALAVQFDGSVVIGSHEGTQLAVYRFGSDGTLDASFGSGGVATTVGALPVGTSPVVSSDGSVAGAVTKLAIQPYGEIVAAGQTPQGGVYALARFTSVGALDSSFGGSGVVLVQGSTPAAPSTASFPVAGLFLQSDGEIVFAGTQPAMAANQNDQTEPLIRRFLSTGISDSSFDDDRVTSALPSNAVAQACFMDPIGNIVVAYNVNIANGAHQIVIARDQGEGGYVVTSLADDGTPGTLRYELQTANWAQQSSGPITIVFTPGLSGTIALNPGALQFDNPLPGLVIAGPGADQIRIVGDEPSTVLFTANLVQAQVQDLTISNRGSGGSGISNGGSMTLLRCDVSNNSGLGIHDDGDITLEDCRITGNGSGGIWGSHTVLVSSSIISSNGSWGIMDASDHLSLTGTTISGNHNGGMFSQPGTAARITNCTISFNQGPALNVEKTSMIDACNFIGNTGGGILNYGANLSVTDTSIDGNSITGAPGTGGGGILNYGQGVMSLVNCTIANNLTNGTGGGILNDISTMTVTNCTITGNMAGIGGGVYDISYDQTYLKMNNSIVALNHNTDGISDDVATEASWLDNFSGSCNLIGTGGSGGLVDGVNGNRVGVANPGLAPLGNYGGPTQTIALMPGSPALDAGSNALAVDANGNSLATDQRGLSRVFGKAVDIGAYEAQPPALMGDVNHDGTVNLADFLVLSRNFGATTPLYESGDLNGDAKANLTDLLLLMHNFGRIGALAAPTLSATDVPGSPSLDTVDALRRRRTV